MACDAGGGLPAVAVGLFFLLLAVMASPILYGLLTRQVRRGAAGTLLLFTGGPAVSVTLLRFVPDGECGVAQLGVPLAVATAGAALWIWHMAGGIGGRR